MIIKSRQNIALPEVTLQEFIFNSIRKYGNDVAMYDNTTKTSITYKQYLDQSVALACGLRKNGLRKGEIVGIVSETCLHYGVVCLGIMACGGIPTTCNPLYTVGEMMKQFSNSKPKYMFASSMALGNVRKVAAQLPCVQNVFTIKPSKGHLSVADLIQQSSMKDYPFGVEIDPKEDLAFLPYSSGTTGWPKGVALTHQNLIASLFQLDNGSMQRNDVIFSIAPCFHIYGFLMHFLSLKIGMKAIMTARFDLMELLKCIEMFKVTIIMAVPPVMVALAKTPGVEEFETSSVKQIYCGAAPLAPSLAHEVCGRLKNAKVGQGWGLTEATPITLANVLSTPISSIGPVCPNTLVKIIDVDTGKILPANQDGEICAKGPQFLKGYFKNPTATQNTIDAEGWFHTGDIGHVDENGYFYIVDRLKELIKFKGFQVAPAELEAVLLRHPQIADAAVIGVPDDVAGELPKAFVVRKTSSLSERDVQKHVEGIVSSFKQLKGGVTFVDSIPKSQSGKILRRELRKFPGSNKSKL